MTGVVGSESSVTMMLSVQISVWRHHMDFVSHHAHCIHKCVTSHIHVVQDSPASVEWVQPGAYPMARGVAHDDSSGSFPMQSYCPTQIGRRPVLKIMKHQCQ